MADYNQSLNKDAVNNLFTSARWDANISKWINDTALWHKNEAGILVATGKENPLPTQLSGRKTNLVLDEVSQVLNIAPGNSQDVFLTPPTGQLRHLKGLYIGLPGLAGNITGGQRMYISFGGLYAFEALAGAVQNDQFIECRNGIFYTTLSKTFIYTRPSQEVSQRLMLDCVVATNSRPVIIKVSNDATSTVTQSGTLSIRTLWEVDYIV